MRAYALGHGPAVHSVSAAKLATVTVHHYFPVVVGMSYCALRYEAGPVAGKARKSKASPLSARRSTDSRIAEIKPLRPASPAGSVVASFVLLPFQGQLILYRVTSGSENASNAK